MAFLVLCSDGGIRQIHRSKQRETLTRFIIFYLVFVKISDSDGTIIMSCVDIPPGPNPEQSSWTLSWETQVKQPR